MGLRVELGNGKTAFMSIEDYLDMTDEKFQKIIASDAGVFISDPFIDFDIADSKKITSPEIEQHIEPLPEEEVEAIKKEIKNEGRI